MARIFLDLLLLAGGLALLTLAGDLLVRGAAALAGRLGVPALVVGLTVVAFGTSAPELFISVQAAIDHAANIAVGNVVGSNIANVLLVVGLPALIATVPTDQRGLRRSVTIMLAVSCLFAALIADGRIDRSDGAILIAVFLAFIAWQFAEVMLARPRSKLSGAQIEEAVEAVIEEEVGKRPPEPARMVLYIVGGLVGLPLGAELAIRGASSIARSAGISETAIGLTIVALGTSLPEIATSLVAARRSSDGLAIGNAVGSNIFNITCIMGLAGLIAPIEVDPRITHVDIWVMLATGAVLAALAFARMPIGRGFGLAAVAGYAVFIYSVF